ncbi:hypothetical protein [Micromonospora sp. NPDC023737]
MSAGQALATAASAGDLLAREGLSVGTRHRDVSLVIGPPSGWTR